MRLPNRVLESTIERKVCAYARSNGWLTYKFTSPSQRGVPDRLFIRNGITLFIEFKQSGKKLTKLQDKVRREMLKAGALYRVVDNIFDGCVLIGHLTEKREEFLSDTSKSIF